MSAPTTHTASLVYEALLVLLRFIGDNDDVDPAIRTDALNIHNEMVEEANRQKRHAN